MRYFFLEYILTFQFDKFIISILNCNSVQDQMNIETKIRNIRFIGELCKFRIAPAGLVFSCLKVMHRTESTQNSSKFMHFLSHFHCFYS